LQGDFVSTFEVKNQKILQVEPQALTLLSEQAMIDIAHLLRPAHLEVNKKEYNKYLKKK
jgi:fumarate hydratase class I